MGYVPDQSMKRLLWAGKCGLWAFGVFTSSTALAQTGAQLPLLVGTGATGVSFSVPVQTLLFFTALSFLPAILLMMTGFTRIVIVLSLMRQALGTQSSPPNQVIVGLSLFLTFFVMGPTLDKVYADAYLPYTKNAITFEQALQKGEDPLRQFMAKQTRQADLSLFVKLAKHGDSSNQFGDEGKCCLVDLGNCLEQPNDQTHHKHHGQYRRRDHQQHQQGFLAHG